MGLRKNPAAEGRLVVTPHPVLVDGQRNVVADLRPGESLYSFLMRHVEDLDGQRWEVSIGGRGVPRHLWHHVFPKHGQLIELRGGVGRAAIAIVAMIALTYFTFGIGTAAAAGMWGAGAVASTYGALAATAVYMAGAVLINQVLAPKQPKASQAAPSTHSISAGRNRARAYEPLGLAFGSIRIAPDLISQPYTHYEGDDQFLTMLLTPGVNVDRVDELYNGEALLSTYEGVQVWHNGFPGMPSQDMPLYSNADVRDGGTLLDTSNDPKGRPGTWVQRSSAAGSVRLMVGVEFQLYDKTSKGKDKQNQEQVQIQYRAAGAQAWQSFGTYAVRGSTAKTQRASFAIDVPEGQYDVRVRVAGLNTDGSGAQASFTWTTLTSIQRDTATYSGIPRIGIRMKATGQLNGAPDEIRCVIHARPIPVWKGDRWITERTSNCGAQILAYARGIYAPDGTLLAGMELPDRQIDIEGLKAFMLHCAANEFTYNHWVTEVRSHQQVLDAVALAGFGQVCWPRGRLSVAWAADEQPLSGVVSMATIKKGQFQVDYMLANTADGIEYSYLDAATWEAKTLRVPAPGVTTMLNPAQVTGEGVTTEAHAAMLARWHLAQTLYQYKSISYSTDIEHLSYSRMSMLALQHDMTQWGYGGRVMGATLVGGRMVLQLDEPVPAPPQGNAFVGLRIPGERAYRVLKVQPFTGTAAELTLADPWPSDAAVPGNSEANPAWDTLWIYDFKQTPGLRVRVTGIRPESDLKGASVDVVAESPEFWHYVKTGEYIPSPNDSLLNTRPVASGLKVTERQVVQGDTQFTELQASWEVTGPVGDTVVLSDLDGNAALEEVARTVTRSASWRIPAAGTYPITVRPYSPDGNGGVAASLIYTTKGADAPPVLVDLFDVEQLSGGVRRYTWGFFADTIQSANFAGVEIRYIAGNVAQPSWDSMTPVGDDGYHASAFEAVLPPAGDWTFACRSRNTSGTLSAGMQVVFKRLPANLGEVIDTIEETVEDQTRKQVEQQQQIDKDRADSIARDAAEAAQRAADYARAQANLVNESALRIAAVKQVADGLSDEAAERADAVKRLADEIDAEVTARAQAVGQVADEVTAVAEAVSDEQAARIEAMLSQKLALQSEISTERTQRQAQGESLAQQISMVAAGSGTQFDSKRIWYFDTTTESWTGNGTLTVVDGMLRPANGTSSYAQTPADLALDGNSYRFIKTRVKRVGDAPWRGLLRWTTDADLTWDDAKSLTVPEPSFDANGLATVDIDLIPWGSTSPIRAVRFALVTVQTDASYLLYDYVAIGRPTPGAGVAMVQEAVTALTNADSAEATARNDLAVQMRGQYSGSDLGGVSSGLIAQERKARVSADEAMAERTIVIEARLPAGSGALASAASVTAVEQASVARDNASAESISSVRASLDAVRASASVIPNGDFGAGVANWHESGWGSTFGWDPVEKALVSGSGSMRVRSDGFAAKAGDQVHVTFRKRLSAGATGVGSDNNVGLIANLANPTDWVVSNTGWAVGQAGEWVERSYAWTVPESFTGDTLHLRFAAGAIYETGSATIAIKDVVVTTPSAVAGLAVKVAANTAATQSLQADVEEVDGKLEAQAAALTQVRTDLGGKADAGALQALDSRVTQQGSELTSQAGQLTQLESGVGSAQRAAEAAAAAAGAKGKVLFQSAAPAAADRLPQNLWIDTTGNANTPKRWNNNAWVAATDKVATDAAAAAAAAQRAASANATAISTMDTRVTTQEGRVDSLANSVVQLSSDAAALRAQGNNLVLNGSWSLGRDVGWSYSGSAHAVVAEGRVGDCWRAVGSPANNYANVNRGEPIAVVAGLKYRVSCWYRTSADYNGTSNNGKLRIAKQDNGLLAALTFGRDVADWTRLEYVVSVPEGGSITSLRVSVGADNTAGTLWVDDVVIEEVTELLANAQATSALSTQVTELEGEVSAAAGALTRVQSDLDSKADAEALQALDTKVIEQGSTLTSQAGQITQLQSGVNTAQGAAEAAATAAGAKGKVIFQSAAPAAADRLPQNLWIDTTGSAFTPKRWNSNAWVAVTDKVARDAAAAAAAAQAASSANASAISNIGTRVTQAEGNIESHGSSIVQLSNGLQGIQGAFTAIPNGSFDQGTAGWADSAQGSSFTWDAEERALRSGAGSIRVVNTTPFSVNPGDTVTVSFRTKSSEDLSSTDAVTVGFISDLSNPTGWVVGFANWIHTVGGVWVPRSYTWKVPSTFNPQQIYLRFAAGSIRPTSSASVLIDDVVVQTPGSIGDLQGRVTANAQAISGLTNTVGLQEGKISSLSSSINQLLNDVAGKASAAALQALDNRVVVAEGRIDAQATALTEVRSGLNNIGGDNQLLNGGFEDTYTHWTSQSNGLGSGSVTRTYVDSVLPNSVKAARWAMANVPTAGYFEFVHVLASNRVTPGPNTFSVYVRGTPGTRIFLQFHWRDASNGGIAYTSSFVDVAADSWGRRMITKVAPANAVWAAVYLRAYGLGRSDQWVEWDNAQLQVGEVATGYAPGIAEVKADVAANATASNQLNTRVGSMEGQVLAQGTALTNVTARLDGSLTQGDNLITNSNFAQELADWSYNNGGGAANSGVWGANSGDGGPGFVITKNAAQNPYVTARNGAYIPVRPSRRYRAVVRAKALSGAGTLLLRLRRRHGTQFFFTDTQLTFSSSAFETLGANFAATAAETDGIALQVFAWPSNTSVAIDRVELYDVTDQLASAANADATSTLDAKVITIDGKVESQGQAITQVRAAANAAGQKADDAQAAADATASGLTATNANVSTLDGKVAAQATQIQQVQSGLGDKANASALIELDARVSSATTGSGNLLTNAGFGENGRANWGFVWNDGAYWNEVGKNLESTTGNWWPKGMNSLGFRSLGNAAPPSGQNRYGLISHSNYIPAEPNKTYCASVWINCHRAVGCAWIAFYDFNGNLVAEQTSAEVGPQGLGAGPGLNELPRPWIALKAPANARTMRMGWRARASSALGGSPYMWAVQPMLELMQEGQAGPSPWSAGGTEDHAGINLMTDVNGNVTGLQVKNDGRTGVINMLANALNILSPGAVDGLELQQGHLRVWKGNVQRIIGNGFGPDGLMDYFGPNVGAGNARKEIATMWMDTNGNGYWGGSLAAGVLRNAVQSTQVTTVGTGVTTGLFSTNGRNKNVIVSFNRYHQRTKTEESGQGFVAGAGANTATVYVYRQIDGQPETLWTTFNAGGSVDIQNEFDGPDLATSTWSGSVTLNDGAGGAAQRSYRAEIVAFTEQNVTHQSGSFNAQRLTQSLSIVSTEV